MRWVSFFVLSLALHAIALVCPVSFAARGRVDEPLRVTILSAPREMSGRGGGEGILPRRAGAKPHAEATPVGHPPADTQSTHGEELQALPVEPIEKISDASIALVSTVAMSTENNRNVASGVASAGLYGGGGTGNEGNPFGSSGVGFGRGSGNGSGVSASGAALTQARYRDTPRPEYPESARRAGREGRVLLRVLVDDQGRSKRVEINSSSGTDALDSAAAAAIRRWRFYPARHGDRAVESWIKIPIEFALANAGAR
ncbi:MAG: energy transducer TonB [Chloroflexota bacterium]